MSEHRALKLEGVETMIFPKEIPSQNIHASVKQHITINHPGPIHEKKAGQS